MDIEDRDVHYFMRAYLANYMYMSKNILPDKVVFPLFDTIPNGKGGIIPIEWAPYFDPAAVEIRLDGSNIPEATEEHLEILEKKEQEIKRLKVELAAALESTNEASVVPAEDPPNLSTLVDTPSTYVGPPINLEPTMPPGGDIGPGAVVDDMGSRDIMADRNISRDLRDDPDINEDEQRDLDHEIKQE